MIMICGASQPTYGIQPTAYEATSKPYRTHGSISVVYAASRLLAMDPGVGSGSSAVGGKADLGSANKIGCHQSPSCAK